MISQAIQQQTGRPATPQEIAEVLKQLTGPGGGPPGGADVAGGGPMPGPMPAGAPAGGTPTPQLPPSGMGLIRR